MEESSRDSRSAARPEHIEVAKSLNNLGRYHQTRTEYAVAESLFARSLAIKEKALGPKHPSMAGTLTNLAFLLRTTGKYEKADSLFRRALAIREEVLGPDHPDVASALWQIANLSRLRARYTEADSLYRIALSIRERTFGVDHPRVASTLSSIANLKRDVGEYREADSLYRAALEIWETALGPEHGQVGWLLEHYALMHDLQKKFEESVLLHVRVVQIQEKTWGQFDPRILSALANHAGTLAGLGRAGAAARVRDRATSIVSRTVAAFLSAESRDSVVGDGSWYNLCRFGGLVGAASEALSACERSFAVSGDSIAIRRSRGLARAMTGDFSGAIDDFNAVVNSDPEHRFANLRRTWIAELEAGRNPFIEATVMQFLWVR